MASTQRTTSNLDTMTAEEASVDTLQAVLHRHSKPLQTSADLDELIEHAGKAQVVMLGEASHGTSEFYLWRTLISQRLIREKGFRAVAVEGDWPDCSNINRYIKGYSGAAESAYEVLWHFKRWPTWMWANSEVERLVEWLKKYNHDAEPNRQAGFYGLDVYSLWESIQAVVDYLDRANPAAAAMARQAYRCFEPYGYNEEAYAYNASLLRNCEDEVVAVLEEALQERADFPGDPEAGFNAEQNALVAKDAEQYYRTMLRGGAASWNLRDRHMMDTLHRLRAHIGADAGVIVWAHNTHIGDARYTDMADVGMFNIGQLARQEIGTDLVSLVGFTMNEGTVIAGRAWEAPMEIMQVPPSRLGSWGHILHAAVGRNTYLNAIRIRPTAVDAQLLKQRAIGVVYHPENEGGNYVPTELFQRYDHCLHIDLTTALHPIHTAQVDRALLPETYPVTV